MVPSRHIPTKDRSSGGEDFKALSRRLEALILLSFVPNEKLACWFELSGLAQGIFNETVSFSEKPVKTLLRAQFGLCFAKEMFCL